MVLGTYTVVNRRAVTAVYCYCFWYDIFLCHAPWFYQFYAENDYLLVNRSGGSPIMFIILSSWDLLGTIIILYMYMPVAQMSC